MSVLKQLSSAVGDSTEASNKAVAQEALEQEKAMTQEIKTITLPMPFRLGSVNCYLVEINNGFVMIDTGAANKRAELKNELTSAGCKPGNLYLIVLTHGDFDHTGNAAYLGEKFGAKIAMHVDDAGMAEHGDMFWNRKTGSSVIRKMTPLLALLMGFPKSSRFKPDFYIEGGTGLSELGFDAQVLSIPGHSKGSIGFLTAGGDLFCGDLFENYGEPTINSIIDDAAAANASIKELQGMKINMVFPGHGKPFPMDSFALAHSAG